MRLPLRERLLNSPFGEWPDSNESDAPEWRPEDAGPEYHAFADAARSSSASEGDMIVTEGAARAIEHGERVEALKLTLHAHSIALDAPDHVWFHVVNELSTRAREGCASCRELTEVLARVLFSL